MGTASQGWGGVAPREEASLCPGVFHSHPGWFQVLSLGIPGCFPLRWPRRSTKRNRHARVRQEVLRGGPWRPDTRARAAWGLRDPGRCLRTRGLARAAGVCSSRAAYLQHVGEVESDAFQQSPVGPPPGSLPGRHVQVALADQSPHFFQDRARIDVVTQGCVNRRLPVVKAEREDRARQRVTVHMRTRGRWPGLRVWEPRCHGGLPAGGSATLAARRDVSYLLFSSDSSSSHFSNRPVISAGARRTSFTFRKNS